jgi:hypothetical protein
MSDARTKASVALTAHIADAWFAGRDESAPRPAWAATLTPV